MKRFIFTQFAFGVAILSMVAAIFYILHGWLGAVLYMAFAAVCLTPAIITAKRVLHDEKGGKQ